jgi:hypothetical protein
MPASKEVGVYEIIIGTVLISNCPIPGKVYETKDEDDKGGLGIGDKKKGEMQMPIELDLDDEEDEEDEEEYEEDEEIDTVKLEKLIDRAPERDLVDLAGILGKYILAIIPKRQRGKVFRHAQCTQPTAVLQCSKGQKPGREHRHLLQWRHKGIPA